MRLREAAPGQLAGWLRSGEADLGLTALPVREPGIAGGPVLVREARLLAVPLGHPFARRESIAASDLGRVDLVEHEGTVHGALALAGAGRGALVVGAHARRYYARPDIAYVPVSDAPPLEWGLIWPPAEHGPRPRLRRGRQRPGPRPPGPPQVTPTRQWAYVRRQTASDATDSRETWYRWGPCARLPITRHS